MIKAIGRHFKWYWTEVVSEPNRHWKERLGTAGIFTCMFTLVFGAILNGINIYYDHFLWGDSARNALIFVTVDFGILAFQRFFMRMALKAQRKRHDAELQALVNDNERRRLTLRYNTDGTTYWTYNNTEDGD